MGVPFHSRGEGESTIFSPVVRGVPYLHIYLREDGVDNAEPRGEGGVAGQLLQHRARLPHGPEVRQLELADLPGALVLNLQDRVADLEAVALVSAGSVHLLFVVINFRSSYVFFGISGGVREHCLGRKNTHTQGNTRHGTARHGTPRETALDVFMYREKCLPNTLPGVGGAFCRWPVWLA